MFRFVLGLLLAALLVLPSAAVTVKPFLYVWRVRAPHATKADYLVGTIHVSWPPGAQLPMAAAMAIAQSDWFVTEVDTGDITLASMAAKMWLPGKARNSERMSKEAWAVVVAEAKRQGLKPEIVDRMAPWLLLLSLSSPADDPKRMPDSLLRLAAEQARKPVRFLEGHQDQMKLFEGPHNAFDEQLAQVPLIRAFHRRLARVYASGDLLALTQLLMPQAATCKYPDAYEAMFYARNDLWLPQVEKAMREHDAVIVVGVGHLVGDRGLVSRLLNKGYEVTLIAPAPAHRDPARP